MFLPHKIIEEKLLRILAEDAGEGDVTTSILIPADLKVKASIVAKDTGVVAGIEEARIFLQSLKIEVEASMKDGAETKPGKIILKMRGDARTILTAERTLLNLLSRMSGIATATRNLVDRLQRARIKARIACTRKTAPGLLYFDKKAVESGGGDTHRLHLDDMVLIKDNHTAIVGGVEKAIQEAREHVSVSKKIEVEVTTVEDALRAARAEVDIIMLDNFSPRKIRKAIDALKKEKRDKKVLLEASGGINAKNFLEFAATGVDLVSLGELTQSSRALNMSLQGLAAEGLDQRYFYDCANEQQ
jgi:nicotinate-nucleotide pyrophosphorylase (carboxylating)